jgi:hypothetical protein
LVVVHLSFVILSYVAAFTPVTCSTAIHRYFMSTYEATRRSDLIWRSHCGDSGFEKSLAAKVSFVILFYVVAFTPEAHATAKNCCIVSICEATNRSDLIWTSSCGYFGFEKLVVANVSFVILSYVVAFAPETHSTAINRCIVSICEATNRSDLIWRSSCGNFGLAKLVNADVSFVILP